MKLLLLEMPAYLEDLDPELLELIQAQLEPDERVDGAIQREGKASARLIQQEMYDQLQAMPPRFRSKAGCGRTLSFEQQQGEWRFVSSGFWIR